MTREDVLKCNLTEEQKIRVEAFYSLADKMINSQPERAANITKLLDEAQTEEDVKAFADAKIKEYKDRQAAKERRAAKKQAKEAAVEAEPEVTPDKKLNILLENAEAAGITKEEILQVLSDSFKERINAYAEEQEQKALETAKKFRAIHID